MKGDTYRFWLKDGAITSYSANSLEEAKALFARDFKGESPVKVEIYDVAKAAFVEVK